MARRGLPPRAVRARRRVPLTVCPTARSVRRVTILASAKPAVAVRRAATQRRGATIAVRSAPEEVSPNASISPSCSIDDPSSCSLADLEMMYVDALWNYYNGGDFTLTD